MELPSAIVTLGTIRHEDSRVAFEQRNESLEVWAYLGVNLLDMSKTPYCVSEGEHSQSSPCPITSPSHHHLYIIHLVIGLHCFYRVQCHLHTISAEK